MKIGELAATTGTSVRLLRYYDDQGLLALQEAWTSPMSYGAAL
ncbi:MerR family DNA-binding transcriptional regulator [Streptomyces syringium]